MEKPKLEVIRFKGEDIVTASGWMHGLTPGAKGYRTFFGEFREDTGSESIQKIVNDFSDASNDEPIYINFSPTYENRSQYNALEPPPAYAWCYNGQWYVTPDNVGDISYDLLKTFTTHYNTN